MGNTIASGFQFCIMDPRGAHVKALGNAERPEGQQFSGQTFGLGPNTPSDRDGNPSIRSLISSRIMRTKRGRNMAVSVKMLHP